MTLHSSFPVGRPNVAIFTGGDIPSGWLIIVLLVAVLASAITLRAASRDKTSSPPFESSVVHPEWSRSLAIYEVNWRQFTPGGTIREFEAHLPRLKDLGVGLLWLMPIHPIGEKNRKGSLGSYYSVRDYRAVNPEFGTMEEFKELVREIHAQGMYVILDWVANHCAWDNPLVSEHPEWFTTDSLNRMRSPVPDWNDVVDFNYDQPGLRDYMIEAMKFWVRDCDVDGFRCDVAGMVPWDFWHRARKELEGIKPVFMLAEDENPEAHRHAFDMTYCWELHHLMRDISAGKKGASDLNRYFDRQAERYPEDAYRMNFTDNHDENSWNGTVQQRMGSGLKTFAVLTATIPGMPLVYSGQEAGMNKSLRFFDKDTIEWKEDPLADLYRTLFQLKRENPALWNGDSGGGMSRVSTSKDRKVFAYLRAIRDRKVLVVLNVSGRRQSVTLGSEVAHGRYRNVLEGNVQEVNPSTRLDLEPWGFVVLSK